MIPFLMNSRAVMTTLGVVRPKLERLREALAESAPESAALIAQALEPLGQVMKNHMVTDDDDERQARGSEYWTGTLERYRERFGRVPPLLYWEGSPAELDRLMEAAMTSGHRLTVRRIFEAQGKEVPLAALLGER